MNVIVVSTYLTYTLLVTSIFMFIGCNILNATYGRYSQPKGWGPLIPAPIAWMIMESPNIWITILHLCYYYYIYNETTLSSTNMVLLSLFFVHYIHRSFIYPYFVSLTNPNAMPLSIMLLAFSFCLFNGTTQSLALIFALEFNENWMVSFQFIIGVTLFLVGASINIHSDYALLNLRLKSSKTTATTCGKTQLVASNKNYFIPTGGFFEYVSCANYFGEILEWIGWALACNSLSGLAFALCTFSNLFPRALSHHEWYKQKFENYPKNRKAVIPFIW